MKNIFLFLSAISFLTSCNSGSGRIYDEKSESQGENKYQLVWQDEFDYSGLPDSTKWKYDTEGNEAGWGNNEAQYYTVANESNAKVQNGILQITARKENLGGKEFTSARLVSMANWKYGRIEVNAKLPSARAHGLPFGQCLVDGHLWMGIGRILEKLISWSMWATILVLYMLLLTLKITSGKKEHKKRQPYTFPI